jgi:hypothetical protein
LRLTLRVFSGNFCLWPSGPPTLKLWRVN